MEKDEKLVHKKYKMRIVRGAFMSQSVIDALNSIILENLEGSEWQSIDIVVCSMEQIRELQEVMVRHFNDNTAPWYMDGYNVDDNSEIIVAFGIDDGENGKIFRFDKNNKRAVDEVIEYGIKKGIPANQMDFMDISF